jgi:Gpi18-like mannosyltransferase
MRSPRDFIKRHYRFFLLLFTAFLIRLPLLFHHGYIDDLGLHKAWGLQLVADGFEKIAELPNSPIDYFPNYALLLFIFKGIAAFYTFAFGWADPLGLALFTALLKLPATIADLLIGTLLYLSAHRIKTGWLKLLPAALYLFSPGVIYDTALWGQVDSIHTLLALAAFFLWFRGKKTAAWVVFVAALMTKIHSVVFLPLILGLSIFEDGFRGFITRRLPAALATVLIVTLPYLLAVGPLKIFFGSMGSVSKYPYITLNAMNIWWPFSRIAGELVRDDRGVIPPVYIGFALFALIAFLIFEFWRRRPSELRTLEAGALLVFAFFMFPTEIHERYLFPFFAFAALPAIESRRFLIAYLALSFGFLINLFFAAEVVIFPWLPVKTRDLMLLVDPWFLVNLIVFAVLLKNFIDSARSNYETSAHRSAGA